MEKGTRVKENKLGWKNSNNFFSLFITQTAEMKFHFQKQYF